MNDRPPGDESMDQWFGGVPGQGWYAPGPGDPVHAPSDEETPLKGTRIRFFYDFGGGPLWSEWGEIPNEPDWLHRELGLSTALIADLLAWVEVQDLRPPGPPYSVSEERDEEQLFRRVQQELKPGLQAVRTL
jgi:hypothetical protein